MFPGMIGQWWHEAGKRSVCLRGFLSLTMNSRITTSRVFRSILVAFWVKLGWPFDCLTCCLPMSKSQHKRKVSQIAVSDKQGEGEIHPFSWPRFFSKIFLKDLLVFILCVWVFPCMYVCAQQMCLLTLEARIGHQMSWNQSYRSW